MKKFLIKNKIWVLGLVYLIGAVAFVWYFFIPGIDKIEQQASKIEEKKLDKKILESRLSQLSQMQEQADQFSQNKESLGRVIGDSEEVIFIQYLEDLAKETNNEIDIQIPESQMEDNKKTKAVISSEKSQDILNKLTYKNFLVMKVTLMGNFQEAYDFIKEVENSQYHSNIVAIDMEKVEKEEAAKKTQTMFSFSSAPEEVSKKYLKTELELILYKKDGSQN